MEIIAISDFFKAIKKPFDRKKTGYAGKTNAEIFKLSGSNIFEVLSKGCPFDFDSRDFGDNKVVQTILNHVDVTIHRKSENDVDLYVRRSFAGYLWDWLKDSAKLI